jgi:hypothetical protein
MHSRAVKRENQLKAQVQLMKRTYGRRSSEAVMAKARVAEFSRLRKINFGKGMTGMFNQTSNAFSTRYPRNVYEWERWGKWFVEDWT